MILQVDQYILLWVVFRARGCKRRHQDIYKTCLSKLWEFFSHLPEIDIFPVWQKPFSQDCPKKPRGNRLPKWPEKNTTSKHRGVSYSHLMRPGAAGPSKPKKPKVWGENRRRMMTYLSLLAGGSTFNQLFGDLWETHRIHGTFVYVPTFIHEIQSNVGK